MNDALDPLEEELSALRPRGVSVELQRRVADIASYAAVKVSSERTMYPPEESIMPHTELPPIHADRVLYIKLGRGGCWEEECIAHNTLRVGWKEVPLNLCMQIGQEKEAEEIRKLIRPTVKDEGAATRDFNALRHFCESTEKVLWVTFFAGRLRWCFSKPQLRELEDKTKIRSVIGSWCDHDIRNQPLDFSRLSGGLLAMQGFRGTICSVKESAYLLQKINGKEPPQVQEAREACAALELKIMRIIRLLNWKDFEVLVDLIFRQAGWQRVGVLGQTQKTLDLDLMSPITAERYCVQIKSQARLADFKAYQKRFEDMEGYTRFYFVVHSPAADLTRDADTDEFQLLLPENIAYLSVKYGLTDWILGKVG